MPNDDMSKFRRYIAVYTNVNILTERLANMADIAAQAKLALRQGNQSQVLSLLWLLERDLPIAMTLCKAAATLDSVDNVKGIELEPR